MIKIEGYSFGRITINNKLYTNDVIVSNDGVIEAKWWRKEGHNVNIEDVVKIIEASPKTVIFGSGSSGLMRVADEVFEMLAKNKIEMIRKPTKEAVKIFNEMAAKGEKVVLAAHLTC